MKKLVLGLVTGALFFSGGVVFANHVQFTDVKPTDWYYEDVMWAVDNGLMFGTSPSEFSPEKEVKRDQVARLLKRYDALVNQKLEAVQTENAQIKAENLKMQGEVQEMLQRIQYLEENAKMKPNQTKEN